VDVAGAPGVDGFLPNTGVDELDEPSSRGVW
jgi:hypothetical protein